MSLKKINVEGMVTKIVSASQSTRIVMLRAKVSLYPYQGLAQKLTENEFDQIVAFIEDHDGLGHLEFEYAVNRMFMDKSDKPKNWTIMADILLAANSAAHPPTKRK